MIALEPGATGAFLARLGPAIDATFGRPRAVLAISARTLARQPALLAAAQHDTVHDFGGFPDALYRLHHDAPGAPALAGEVQALLGAAGIPVARVERGGLDHGIWTALRYLYPDADVPKAAARAGARPGAVGAVRARRGAGAAAPRRRARVRQSAASRTTCAWCSPSVRRPAAPHREDTADSWEMPSQGLRGWFAERSAARDWDALFAYRRAAPHAALMHPTDEHLLPWYPAAGAGGHDAAAAPARDRDARLPRHGLLRLRRQCAGALLALAA